MRSQLAADPNLRVHRWVDELNGVRPWYNTPWPLSENYFLSARAGKRDQPPAIFMVDVFGNEILVHAESGGCYSPMPLAAAARPVAIPSKRDYGTGSAYFAVPADRFVYFQLLDENGMMIQSMRSGTSIHSGETSGCVGCHESRQAASVPPPGTLSALATRRAPSELRPWHGPARAFSFIDEVQPVFDRHCVRCHDIGMAKESRVILARDRTPSFNFAYMDLWVKGYVGAIGAGPAGHLQACSWGSHTSRLIELLREGQEKVKLDPESLDRLITWVDINGPYYPTPRSTYPGSHPGRWIRNGPSISNITAGSNRRCARRSARAGRSATPNRNSPGRRGTSREAAAGSDAITNK